MIVPVNAFAWFTRVIVLWWGVLFFIVFGLIGADRELLIAYVMGIALITILNEYLLRQL